MFKKKIIDITMDFLMESYSDSVDPDLPFEHINVYFETQSIKQIYF